MCQCYRPQDVDWLLDLYFGARDRLLRHEFLPVVTALPVMKVRARIALESKHPDALRREAAKVAGVRLGSWLDWLGRQSNIQLRPAPTRRPRVASRRG